ncbi:M23 family metallopeptidase [Stakelama sp. CBK3Z-3]|uniref:M23 family metallopeptidase n=1 Tax=Stakelama flava TaxID=2860338 RepID=A0ABS6XLA1_9SPHN|nr:M23 family metallopeptidase [Stakelama flava]MBW4330984.1 M23 family metallopeptidase [Stakelama flava]
MGKGFGRWVIGSVGVAASLIASTTPVAALQSLVLPPQIWMRTPYAPIAFPADGGHHFIYELYLTNLSSAEVRVKSLDIIDPDNADREPLRRFTGKQLTAIAQPLGEGMSMDESAKPISVAPGRTVALFLAISVPQGEPLPEHLAERLTYSDGTVVTGGTVEARHPLLKVLGPPVRGSDWDAADGPGNGRYNHHRRGIFVIDGHLADSRRFAIDWKQVRNGASFSGDKTRDSSYYAYRQPVLAVADAVVIEARDGLPDNPPGHGVDFHPAAALTFDKLGGNTITLDLGDGQYAHYYHLHPGSLRVKVGDHVQRGQVIARIGASGDAREPHLHFEVSTTPSLLTGEGVPYVIDRYRVLPDDGHKGGVRRNETPLDGMIIDFGPATSTR